MARTRHRLRKFDSTTHPELERGPGGTGRRPEAPNIQDDIAATRNIEAPPEQPFGLRRLGGQSRPVQPIVGRSELEEMQRRARIDAASAITNPSRRLGTRSSRGLTIGQRAQLQNAPTAADFLHSRLDAMIKSRQENPTAVAAKERGLRRLENDRNFNLGEQEIAVSREAAAAQERVGLRDVEERGISNQADIQVRQADTQVRLVDALTRLNQSINSRGTDEQPDTSGLMPTRDITDDKGNVTGTVFDYTAFGNMDQTGQRAIASNIGTTVASQLTVSGITAPEKDVGNLAFTMLQNTSSELAGMNDEKRSVYERVLPNDRGGVERLMVAALALPSLGKGVSAATSLPQALDQIMELTANEKASWFGLGRNKSRVGEASIDFDKAQGFARTQINTLRAFTRQAAAEMALVNPTQAKKALRAILKSDLDEIGTPPPLPGTSFMGANTIRPELAAERDEQRVKILAQREQIKELQKALAKDTPEGLARVREYMLNQAEKEALAEGQTQARNRISQAATDVVHAPDGAEASADSREAEEGYPLRRREVSAEFLEEEKERERSQYGF